MQSLVPQVVRTSALLGGLPEPVLRSAIQLATRRQFDSGSFLFHERQPAMHCFLLLAGRVRLSVATAEGSRVLLGLVCPGDFIGYQVAARSPAPYDNTAQAALGSEALCWERECMQHLLRSQPALLFNLFSDFIGRIHECRQRLVDIATQTASRRIARALVRLASTVGTRDGGSIIVDGGFSGADLAEMTGTTFETVSRVLGRWRQAQIVQTGRQSIRISSFRKLMDVAGEPSS